MERGKENSIRKMFINDETLTTNSESILNELSRFSQTYTRRTRIHAVIHK